MYQLEDLTAAEVRKSNSGGPIKIKGDPVSPHPGRHSAIGLTQGKTVQKAVDRLLDEGRIWYKPGNMPRCIRYLDELPGACCRMCGQTSDPLSVAAQSCERLDYFAHKHVHKPGALLGADDQGVSNPWDLVLDCFVGSGTTAAVAERLGRRWITTDLSRFVIHTTRKRLAAISGARPFIIQNPGKYERQVWANTEFEGDAGNMPASVGNLPTGSEDALVARTSPGSLTVASARASARQVAAPDGLVARSTQTELAARQQAYIEFIL